MKVRSSQGRAHVPREVFSHQVAASPDAVQRQRPASSPLGEISQKFSRQDLEHARTRKRIIRESLSLILTEQNPVFTKLSPSERHYLIDFMAKDPIIRRSLFDYLKKVLP